MSIVITGNPGVGKHSITHQIAKRLDLDIIDINNIAKDSGLFEKSDDTNDVDTKKLGEILKQKISEKSVVVGHLAPYVLEKDQVKIMIVLRRNPYDLFEVYKERKYTDEKSRENAGSEVLGIIAHDARDKFQEKAFQINSSGRTIQEVVEKVIIQILNNTNSEEIDWLGLVTKNHDLKKFFAD